MQLIICRFWRKDLYPISKNVFNFDALYLYLLSAIKQATKDVAI